MQGPTRVAPVPGPTSGTHMEDLVHPSPCESYDSLHFIAEETKPAEKGDSLPKITQ